MMYIYLEAFNSYIHWLEVLHFECLNSNTKKIV